MTIDDLGRGGTLTDAEVVGVGRRSSVSAYRMTIDKVRMTGVIRSAVANHESANGRPLRGIEPATILSR